MSAASRSLQSTRHGFTIVELLIVIVVIAILATITIIAFNGVQDKARTAAVQADINSAAKKIEAAKYDSTSEQYPATLPTIASSSTTTTYTTYNNQKGYCAQTTSNASSSKSMYITAGGKPKEGTCATITNLVINPSAETGTTGWGGPNGATFTQIADSSMFGSNIVRYTAPASNIESGAQFSLSSALTANTTYTASFTLRAITAGYYTLSVQGATGVGSNSRDGATMTAGQTRRFSLTWTTTTAGSAVFYALRSTPFSGATNTFDVDGAMLYASNTAYDYADPSINTSWTWAGTAHASASTGPGI